ncbi:MAG: hypothetical protein IPF99_40965 [Deltaproteobacteria bacterium]|nr:hypothetical protein [Deltaproteobacteria bacterium]
MRWKPAFWLRLPVGLVGRDNTATTGSFAFMRDHASSAGPQSLLRNEARRRARYATGAPSSGSVIASAASAVAAETASMGSRYACVYGTAVRALPSPRTTVKGLMSEVASGRRSSARQKASSDCIAAGYTSTGCRAALLEGRARRLPLR